MICSCCHQEVSTGLYCSLCGWKQTLTPTECTLSAVYQKWAARKYPKISAKYARDYKNAYRYLAPMYNTPLPLIDVDELQDIIDNCPPSASARQKVQVLLNQLSKFAIPRKIITAPLGQGVDFSGRLPAERMVFTQEQIRTLEQYARKKTNAHWQAARVLLCLIFTGFRPSEFFGIKLSMCDIKARKIVGGGKTLAGTDRTVPILPAIYDFVAEWYLDSYFANPQNAADQYLIRNSKGHQMLFYNWRARHFYPLMFELGFIPPDIASHLDTIPHLTPYCARHTFASLARAAGVDKDLLIKIFGHANFELTNKVYIHEDFTLLAGELAKINVYMDSNASTAAG